MTIKQAFDSICEDGIAKGAGDFVDPEALEVAAVVMAKVLRGKLVEVVRCKDCKHWRWSENNIFGEDYGTCVECLMDTKKDHFCSYGERKDNE